MNMQTPVGAAGKPIVVKDLCFSYDPQGNAPLILKDINLEIAAGEFFVLVGPSGCGKTTLLRALQGLHAASSGEVRVGDERVTEKNRDSGFVFQSDALFPWRNILSNVAIGLEIRDRPKRERHAIAREMIDLVGLAGYENRYPHELSGGMRQRANLARALAIRPPALMMDEPFAALDAFTRQAMQYELLRIASEAGTTIVFITHQIDEAVLLGDRVGVMSAHPGQIASIVEIDLPRPRPENVRQSLQYQKHVAEINGMIVHSRE